MLSGTSTAGPDDNGAVILAVVVLLATLGLGRLLGGRLGRLGELSLRSTPLASTAFAVQVLGGLVGGPAYAVGLGLAAALVGGFLLRNRGVRGTGLITLGLLANTLVVGLNGAMPVAGSAAGRAGVSTQALLTGADPRHELMDDQTRLRALSDVLPAPWPVVPEVLSPGDVLIAAGLGQLVLLGMLGSAGIRQEPRPAL